MIDGFDENNLKGDYKNEQSSVNIKNYKYLVLLHNDKNFSAKVSSDWFVNGTLVAKFLGKKIGDWLKYNSTLVTSFQIMNGLKPIMYTVRGRYGGTWVNFELLIEITRSYDKLFSWKISCWYKQQFRLVIEENKKLEESLSNLKKKKTKILLNEGPYIYAYLCNGIVKSGDSLVNPMGFHVRTNSHAVSVPRLKYAYIIYLRKEYVIKFRKLIKDRFEREQNNRDHFTCSIKELETFLICYCKLMDWDYKYLSKNKLEVYNGSL